MSGLSSSQPYPGLRPFEQADREYFFGRDAQTRGLRQKLDASRLVAVVGRSGCGKSSLVKAGLIPALAKEKADGEPIWRVALFRPQGRPIEELCEALLGLVPGVAEDAGELRRSRLAAMLSRSSQGLVEAASELGLSASGRLLIIVDQFEEIFRFEDPGGKSADEATAFVRLLIEAINAESPKINVILTMRLDFLGDCARFQRLPEAISDGQYLVPTLSRAERRAAIEEPAKKAGKLIRPEVTQRLLNEIGDDPDQLPVLQHLLMRMWQHAGANAEITLKDYDRHRRRHRMRSRATPSRSTGICRATATGRPPSGCSRPSPNATAAAARSAEPRRSAISRRLWRATTRRARPPRRTKKLLSVIDAFRAPDCCFLMPPAGAGACAGHAHRHLARKPAARLEQDDRRTRTTRAGSREEERDGRIYDGLLEDETRIHILRRR